MQVKQNQAAIICGHFGGFSYLAVISDRKMAATVVVIPFIQELRDTIEKIGVILILYGDGYGSKDRTQSENNMINFPSNWIKPKEFHWCYHCGNYLVWSEYEPDNPKECVSCDPNGDGLYRPVDKQKTIETHNRLNELRNKLANERRDRGLPPLFYMMFFLDCFVKGSEFPVNSYYDEDPMLLAKKGAALLIRESSGIESIAIGRDTKGLSPIRIEKNETND